MKKMNKVALALALCVSTQAFGWVIRFDRNTYMKDNVLTGSKYEILVFPSFNDFNKAFKKEFVGTRINESFLELLPVVGKGAGSVIIPEPQTMVVLKSIEAGSKFFTEALQKGFLTRPINFLTREYHTIDYISDFRPSTQVNYKCKDKKSLANHWTKRHTITTNQSLYYVVYDKKTKQLLYAGEGPAYGFFNIKLVNFVDENNQPYLDENGLPLVVGDWQLIDATGGENCPAQHGEIPLPAKRDR